LDGKNKQFRLKNVKTNTLTEHAMNGTPRMRGAFPHSPNNGTPTRRVTGNAPLPTIPQASTASSSSNSPLIPLNIIDAPSQRFYVLALYFGLLAWRLWDFNKLVADDVDSFWLFIKWVAIDGVFLYGLPGMRIPWLEWSHPTITSIFLGHAIFNGMLMFRIAIPIEGFFTAFAKYLYDRELSVSENRVKPASILHNSSLIMGKQIINILPEGSATLNPQGLPFCLDHNHPSVKIPIRVNQTLPVHIELLRIDFDTNTNETVSIKPKEARAMIKHAQKKQTDNEEGLLMLEYTVKKTGLYRLQRVVDETKLEVQRRMSDTLVVSCPTAYVKPVEENKCIGQLSDLTLQVQGTPPLKIVYSRTVNKEDQSFHFQSIQPENLVSPLLGITGPGTLLARGQEDVSWARSYKVDVPLNESMSTRGEWLYSIDEVHDATGNIANFSARGEDGEHLYPKNTHLQQAFIINERPRARLEGCDFRSPLRVAKGNSVELPVRYDNAIRSSDDAQHTIKWQFSPIETLTTNGDHGEHVIEEEFVTKKPNQGPLINRPGLYTLKSVSSKYCEGEIREPSSCMLLNPPEPDLSITSEDIYDKCAGNSIGLSVDLDLLGTPPFTVRYEISRKGGGKPVTKSVKVDGLRHQLQLKPTDAGHYTYRFKEIDDNVYTGHQLLGSGLTLEQDVKPPASAYFRSAKRVAACIEEPVSFAVQLQGEAPFTLEYELVHGGKRNKQKITDIEASEYVIETAPLVDGGEYSLALASIQDKTGCKIFLKDEVKIDVRRQRPKASFGQLDNKRSTLSLEGKQISLPLRLTGEAPWTVKYRNLEDPTSAIREDVLRYTNDVIKVKHKGTYEILGVYDNHCPGTVDPMASQFDVDWIARPQIKVAESASIKTEDDKHIKREVCEGDVDAVEVNLFGI
jgi:nucleoporin POM152